MTPTLAPSRTAAVRDAVLTTLAYSDLFDFPLTSGELTTYLYGLGATEAEVVETARACPDVVELDGWWCLRGRQHLVAERRRRQTSSAQAWRKARRYGRLIAAAPFVRMVAVTGSLAPGNSRPGDDIDFLLVTAAGRLWLARLLVLLLVRTARLLGDELCPNFVLADSALGIDGSAFPAYYARELAQMAPLSGGSTYTRLRLANGWVARRLPNSNHVLRPGLPDGPSGLLGSLQRAAEHVLSWRGFDALERAEATRKIRRLRQRQGRDGGVLEASPERCRGHFGAYVPRMMELFELRREALTNGGDRG